MKNILHLIFISIFLYQAIFFQEAVDVNKSDNRLNNDSVHTYLEWPQNVYLESFYLIHNTFDSNMLHFWERKVINIILYTFPRYTCCPYFSYCQTYQVTQPIGTTSKPNCRLTSGSVCFRPISIVLNNDNRPELDGTAGQPAVGFWSRP